MRSERGGSRGTELSRYFKQVIGLFTSYFIAKLYCVMFCLILRTSGFYSLTLSVIFRAYWTVKRIDGFVSCRRQKQVGDIIYGEFNIAELTGFYSL